MATFEEIKKVRKEVESDILRTQGVQGVATGYKRVNDEQTDELALIIFVAKKIHSSRLSDYQTLPSSMKVGRVKVPTDIVEVGYFSPYSYTRRERPAKGGCSIGHLSVTSGTLGGYVIDEDTYEFLILSNNHILANGNCAQTGDHISQPGTIFGGYCHDDCIAELERLRPLYFTERNALDCAVAKPFSSVPYDALEIHDVGMPHSGEIYSLTQWDVEHRTLVQKVGSISGHTEGYVDAIDWTGKVNYERASDVYFYNQILIRRLGSYDISLPGDSGSLVLTMDSPYPKISGLLFAGNNGHSHYLANHIDRVFERLNLNLMCAAKEAVRGTGSKEFIPELRDLRDVIKDEEKYRGVYALYNKISPKLLQAMLQKPKFKNMARTLIEDIGQSMRNPEKKIDPTSVKLGLEFIGGVSDLRKNDKDFLRDMDMVRKTLKKMSNKTIQQILGND